MLASGAAVAVAAAGGTAWLSRRGNRQLLKDAIAARNPPRELDRSAPTGELTPAEQSAIVALAEVLYPPDPGLDLGPFVRAYAARRCGSDAGYLPEYQRAARLLDERTAASRAGAAFADLSRAQRDAILHSLLWSYSGRRFVGATARFAEGITVSEDALSLRRFIMADLLHAYYSSPQGWAVVGYSHCPGVPAADPLDYTRPVEG